MHESCPIPSAKARRVGKRSARSAFTLIELLVVIGVVALIAALLLPALGKAKSRAAGIKCLANNRQLMVAWQLYTDDNDGRLLLAADPYDNPRPRAPVWVTGVLDFDPANRSNWDYEEDLARSPLWLYCGESAQIWKCPADTSGVRISGRFRPRVRSLAMNLWVGGFENLADTTYGLNFRAYHALGDFHDPGPARTWLLMDQREDSINWGAFGTMMQGWPDQPEELRFREDFPASYHHRAAGLSFVDGHAEIHEWLDPRTMPPLQKGGNALFRRGLVPSPNNPDIRWLQEHCTRKL